MSKNAKIIIFLLLVFLGLAVYLILTLKEVNVKTKTPLSSEEYAREVQENLKKIDDTYKVELKKIFADYDALVAASPVEMDKEIVKLRDRIKALTVPAQYKDMHLNLFLAFSGAERLGAGGLDSVVEEISGLTTEARVAYPWLK